MRRPSRLLSAIACLLTVVGMTAPFSDLAVAQVMTRQVQTRAPAAKPNPRPAPKPVRRRAATPDSNSTPVAATPISRPNILRDPAVYCSVHPDEDTPGPTYIGQPVPGWVSAAWLSAAGQSASQERAFSWRCMGGRVLACSSAPDRQDCSKPDDSKVATPEMISACTGKRRGALPVDLVGNSIAIWNCSNGAPTITGYRSGLDPRSYFAAQWRDVTDFSPANMVGGVPRSVLGSWVMRWKPTFGEMLSQSITSNGRPVAAVPRGLTILLRGGQVGTSVGTIDYFFADRQGSLQLGCRADLFLVSSTPGKIEVDERLKVQNVQCGNPDRLTLAPRDGQLLIEWRSPSASSGNKPKRSGWAQRQ